MANEVYVALPEEPGGPLEVLRERAGALESVNLPFRPARGAEVIAIAPATRVAHFCLPLPARNDAEALQAAPFAIEDDLAQPVEDVHLALGPRRKESGLRDIYAADRTLVAGWISQLDDAGFVEASLVPEQAFVDAGLSRVDLPDHILLRQDGRIVAIGNRLPPELRGALLGGVAEGGERSSHRLLWLAGRRKNAADVDLRSGAFAVRRRADTGLRAWGLAAGLGLAAFILWTASQYAEAAQRAAAAEGMRTDAARKYAEIFPGAPVPADMDQATRQMLSAPLAEEGFGFHAASSAIFHALARTSGSRLEALKFDQAAKQMTADVRLERADDLGYLVNALDSGAFSVSAMIDPGAAAPEVRVQITLGAPS